MFGLATGKALCYDREEQRQSQKCYYIVEVWNYRKEVADGMLDGSTEGCESWDIKTEISDSAICAAGANHSPKRYSPEHVTHIVKSQSTLAMI